jgi:hypothetical protein
MSSGYVRQSAGQIVTANTIQASDFNNEYNQLQSAFDGTTGHTHTGGTGLGALIPLTTSVTGVLPVANGGTGIANGTNNTITFTGNYTLGITLTGNTTITMPTSGTLLTTGATSMTSLTAIGTIVTGTWNATVITGQYGGTGVANTGNTITVGGNLSTAAAFTTSGGALTLTVTNTTNVTLPTSGTLVNSAVTTLSSLASIGTITSGTWHGTAVGPAYGGTGVVNNASSTLTISGSFGTTLTVTGTTSVTLPTSGTLVNTGVTSLSSLVTVGTITSGTWNGTAIAVSYGGTGSTTAASALTALGAAATGATNTFTGAQIGNVTALTSSGASIATDFSVNNNFSHTFTENTTLANPSNIVAGQSGVVMFTQHASSPKTLAFGSYWKFAGGIVPTISAVNSATDSLYYNVRSSTFIEANLVNAFA